MQEIINIPEYHRQRSVRPRGFLEIVDMIDTQGKITGIWQFEQWDPKTGKTHTRIINKNVVTDNGAVNILASAIAAASNANPWNDLLITNNSASTTLAVASGTVATTTINVAALPAALPANSTIQVGYGSGTTQNIAGPTTLTAQGTSGALTVPSWTPTINFAIGTAVVPVPSVTDNPTNANLTANASTPLSQYSGALASGAFTYAATTGAGNRNVVVVFTFKTAANGGSTAIGSYTDAWLVNVASGASNATTGLFVGNYVAHEINTPMRCDNSNNATVTVTIKL